MKNAEESYHELFQNLKQQLKEICNDFGGNKFLSQEKNTKLIILSLKDYLEIPLTQSEQKFSETIFVPRIDKNITLVALIKKLPSFQNQAGLDYWFTSPLAEALGRILSHRNYKLDYCQKLYNQIQNHIDSKEAKKEDTQDLIQQELGQLREVHKQITDLLSKNQELNQQVILLREEKLQKETKLLDEQRKLVEKDKELFEKDKELFNKEKELNETKRVLNETMDQLNQTRMQLEESKIVEEDVLNVTFVNDENITLESTIKYYQAIITDYNSPAENIFTKCTLDLLTKDINTAWTWLGSARGSAAEKLRRFIHESADTTNSESFEILSAKSLIFGLCRYKDKSIKSIIQELGENKTYTEKLRSVIKSIQDNRKSDELFCKRAWTKDEYNVFRQLYNRSYYFPKHKIAFEYFDSEYTKYKTQATEQRYSATKQVTV